VWEWSKIDPFILQGGLSPSADMSQTDFQKKEWGQKGAFEQTWLFLKKTADASKNYSREGIIKTREQGKKKGITGPKRPGRATEQ